MANKAKQQTEQQARWQAFADALAGIIGDDDTPASIHNSLIDWINEVAWDTRINMDTPEVIRAAVPMMLAAADGKSEVEREGDTLKQPHTEADPGGAASAMTWRDERNAVPKLTIERARELVHRILQNDEDEEAMALVELVTGIAYDPDAGWRDGLALWTTHAAYSLTTEFSNAAERFATKAATRQ